MLGKHPGLTYDLYTSERQAYLLSGFSHDHIKTHQDVSLHLDLLAW